jgi:hypothetical protein
MNTKYNRPIIMIMLGVLELLIFCIVTLLVWYKYFNKRGDSRKCGKSGNLKLEEK